MIDVCNVIRPNATATRLSSIVLLVSLCDAKRPTSLTSIIIFFFFYWYKCRARSSSMFERERMTDIRFIVASMCRRPSSRGRHRANRVYSRVYVRVSEIRTHRLLVRSMSRLRLYATSPSPLHACTLCNNAGKAWDPLISTIWSRVVAPMKLREGIFSPSCKYTHTHTHTRFYRTYTLRVTSSLDNHFSCSLRWADSIINWIADEFNKNAKCVRWWVHASDVLITMIYRFFFFFFCKKYHLHDKLLILSPSLCVIIKVKVLKSFSFYLI